MPLTAVPDDEEPDVPDDELADALAEDPPTARPLGYQPDIAALRAAAGDPHVWAHEFGQLVASITGAHFDETVFVDYLASYAGQVQQLAYRDALFQVANTTLPNRIAGDTAMLMLELRNDIAAGFRHPAGLA